MGFQYDASSNTFSGDSYYADGLAQVMWHITNQCKLNCMFCFSKYLRNDTSELSTDIINQNIALFKKLGVLKLDISGGEPLLVKLLPYIVDMCYEANIDITITTSGSGTEENIQWLINNWCKFSRIILSLDGTKDLHNSLRGTRFAYQNLILLCNSLTNCGCDRIRINTVVTKQLLDLRDSFLDLIISINPKEWCCIEPHPTNKVDTFDKVSIQTSDFLNFVNKCNESLHKTEISFLFRTKLDFSSYWTLYPNQLICHLSETDTPDFKTHFNKNNYLNILENVKKFPQFCIKRKVDNNVI